ncbi:non-hydrolyzing UDP-N-acetylglucosamine 2-epimerase [Sideroxyarcus emersonii]|nr:UDP-N-acetylglucosamine 2-epimerase (non-hydrolyzing) [Sideroxyarcus emersonii]
MRKIIVAAGTHSEALHMAPLVLHLQSLPSIQTIVCVAAQYRHAVLEAFGSFGIESGNTILCEQAPEAGGSHPFDRLLEQHRPDCVLLHGDTMMAAGSRYLQLPAGRHAGVCMHELRYPVRQGASDGAVELAASNHFVPTELLRGELLAKGIAPEKIFLTDSIAVDAMLLVVERIRRDDALRAGVAAAFPFLDPGRRLIFVNAPRYDNSDARLESICRALKRLAVRTDVQLVYQAGHDTRANDLARDIFANHPGIVCIEPQDYLHSAYLLHAAYLILTDLDDTLRGALSLGKPVLVLRDISERPATVDAGTIRLVGCEAERIQRECGMFLDDPSYYRAFSAHRNPFGDGHASQRIVETLLR